MRLHAWVLAMLVLALVAVSLPSPAQALPNNIVIVDPEGDAPADLLSPEEVERITRLQRDAVFIVPISPVSPDDRLVLVISDEQIAFLDLNDGSTTPIDPESFEPFVLLPLAGFSAFTWLDPTGLGAFALNLLAPTPEEAFFRLRIDSESLEVTAEPIPLLPDTLIYSVAPNLRSLLVALLPPSEEDQAGEEGESASLVKVRVTYPTPGPARAAELAMPPALRHQLAEARRLQPAALARLDMLQEGDEGTLAVTPRTMDLVLIGDGGMRYVTTIPETSFPLGDVWTRDSARLAVSFTSLSEPDVERERFDGALLSEELYRDVTGNLAPENNPLLQNNNTYVIDAASGAVQILPAAGPGAPPLLEAHGWSPDNSTLLVKAWHPARIKGRTYPIYTPQFSERSSFRFYSVDMAQGLRESGRFASDLLSGAAEARADFVSPDEIFFRAQKGTDRHVYYYNRVSGELRNLADRAGAYFNVFSTNNSRRLVFTYTSFSNPPDVYTLGWDGTGLTRLTWFGEELRVYANLRENPVSFRLPNGQTRVGVLIQPADAPFPPRNTRIVVWQEGGPGVRMLNNWETIVERPFGLLPGMGTALLVTPLAGRPGYTPAVFNSLSDGANMGQIDIDEQAAIVREMIRRGWTSQGKVGITGCSYGGYFAAQSIVRYPDLYAAANPQCALVDWITEWTRGYATLGPQVMGLPPFNIPDEYRRDSPLYNAPRVKAAVLTFHGTEDFLPITLNENFHLQLVNRGVPARMVKFIGEGHGLAEEDNQLYAAQEQVLWFRTHLK